MIKSGEDRVIKRMAELLKSGAIMLNDYCPYCHVPLFKLKSGEIICPSCGRRVIYVKEGEEEVAEGLVAMESVRRTLLKKIKELNTLIDMESDPQQLMIKINLLSSLLEALDKLNTILKNLKSRG